MNGVGMRGRREEEMGGESKSLKWWWSLAYLVMVLMIVYKIDDEIANPIKLVTKSHKKKMSPVPLSFRSSDGTFKILQVADLHFGNGPLTRCRDFNHRTSRDFLRCSDLNSTLFLRRLLKLEAPDFIAFTGDNVFGPSAADAAESLLAAVAPAIDSGIPWAAVLGNHDHEDSAMDRPQLMFFLSLLDYSLSRLSPSSEDADIDGFGNFDLRVVGPPGTHLANTTLLDLLFLDSGDRETVGGVRTYGWIKESQLRWLWRRRRRSNSGENAVAFFHIPIPEMRSLYYERSGVVGEFQEWVSSSTVDSGVLSNMVAMGDVKAVFVGHDHVNDFCGNLKGIWFCYGGGFGYHAYGKRGWSRRARVILAQLGKGDNHRWTKLHTIHTWKRLDDHNFTMIDHQLLWHE